MPNDVKQEPGKLTPLKMRLILTSLKSSRRTYCKLLKLFSEGGIDIDTGKFWISAMSSYLHFLKRENEQDSQARLEVLENLLKKEGRL